MRNKISLNEANIKILVCCHKPCKLPPNSNGIFLPVQVGAAISDVNLGIQRDDQVNDKQCDNISAKNKNYCELTALYWAWKNIKKIYPNIRYIGLCHYRRYFVNLKKYLGRLKPNTCITSKLYNFPWSVEVQYKKSHISDDFNTLKDVVHRISPEYDIAFNNVLVKGNRTLYFNMFICSYELFEQYCKWLFSVLFEIEQQINIENYSTNQKRIFGYMAERLLLVFLKKNKIKLIKTKVNNTESEKKENKLKAMTNFIRYNISFFFNRER